MKKHSNKILISNFQKEKINENLKKNQIKITYPWILDNLSNFNVFLLIFAIIV